MLIGREDLHTEGQMWRWEQRRLFFRSCLNFLNCQQTHHPVSRCEERTSQSLIISLFSCCLFVSQLRGLDRTVLIRSKLQKCSGVSNNRYYCRSLNRVPVATSPEVITEERCPAGERSTLSGLRNSKIAVSKILLKMKTEDQRKKNNWRCLED